MLQLADRSWVEKSLDEIAGQLEHGKRAWVVAQSGGGRNTLIGAMERRWKELVVVRLPPFEDADAVLHGLMQSARDLGPAAIATCADDTKPLVDRARDIATELALKGLKLVVWVPASWHFVGEARDDEDELRRSQAQELLQGWFGSKDLQWVLLSTPRWKDLARTLQTKVVPERTIALPPPRLDPTALKRIEQFAGCADAARAVVQALEKNKADVTPLQFRLMVGLVHLGEQPNELLRHVTDESKKSGPSDLRPLVASLKYVLQLPNNARLASGIRRVLKARFDLPPKTAVELAALPPESAPILTECIGYGSSVLRITESVRRDLLRALERGRHGDASAHLALADHYQNLDGVTAPDQTSGAQLIHWLEKVHHLGHSGPEGVERWSKQKLMNRQFYWDRAKSLSVEYADYAGAAALYRESLKRFGDDAYAWHYLGFNLDRAGATREEVEPAYRRAWELERTHAWWNGRYLTFLINRSLFRQADQAWPQALERVDPDREVVGSSAWLARNLHRYVVEAWLDKAEVARAVDVFASIPESVIDQDADLRQLKQRVLDAKEALELGVSVYPATLPVESRWKQPLAAQAQVGTAKLRRWFPGRITATGKASVTLTLVTPDQERRVIVREVAADEWVRLADWSRPLKASGFIELGEYDDGSVRLFRLTAPAAPVPTASS